MEPKDYIQWYCRMQCCLDEVGGTARDIGPMMGVRCQDDWWGVIVGPLLGKLDRQAHVSGRHFQRIETNPCFGEVRPPGLFFRLKYSIPRHRALLTGVFSRLLKLDVAHVGRERKQCVLCHATSS
jgi:hypothetical protein